jgi:DNA uptake protein ComE-like DNA-binding protein
MSTSTEKGPNAAISLRRTALIRLAGALAIITAIATCFDRQGPESPPALPLRVDVNIAPPGVLEALPRIGPALAGRIVEAREETLFVSADDLDRRVRGIGPATIAGLRPYLRFD